jgi:hypothetical protein
MTASQIDALIASSFNVHFGGESQKVLTPADAAALSRADRATLCLILEIKGGSDLYSAAQARAAYQCCVS